MKQVIVLRKDLNMRKGKMVAQGAHASMAAILQRVDGQSVLLDHDYVQAWLKEAFTKICVSVDSEEELLDVCKRAQEARLPCSLITDSGLTEFRGIPTNTAVAVGPGPREEVDAITGNLKLL